MSQDDGAVAANCNLVGRQINIHKIYACIDPTHGQGDSLLAIAPALQPTHPQQKKCITTIVGS